MKNALLSLAVLFGVSIGATTSMAQNQAVIIPSGTAMRVRTMDPIDVDSARPGARFRGSLADPVKNRDGAVLIPRGAPVQLSVASVNRSGRMRGRDRIDLKVESITFNGQTHPVVSTISESRGSRQGRRTLRGTGIGAGAGALIGGLAGGATGLGVGALIGGGGGTAVAAATGGKHLTIPPETVLSFQLQSPLRAPR